MQNSSCYPSMIFHLFVIFDINLCVIPCIFFLAFYYIFSIYWSVIAPLFINKNKVLFHLGFGIFLKDIIENMYEIFQNCHILLWFMNWNAPLKLAFYSCLWAWKCQFYKRKVCPSINALNWQIWQEYLLWFCITKSKYFISKRNL